MKVLIVEDDYILRENLSELLSFKGFSTENACNGMQALKLMSECAPDLILSDYDMPELDGLDLLKEIKSSDEFDKIPFVMMTGNAHPGLAEKAKSLGAKAFLEKPFLLSDFDTWLLEQVQQAQQA